MFQKLTAPALGSLVLIIASAVSGQTPAPKPPAGQPPAAPGFLNLTGEDEKRANQLHERIEKAMTADRWDEAIARAEELVALRTRAQGPKHFETVNEDWRLKTLGRVAKMAREDRVTYQSANTMDEQARALHAQGKHAQAQPLHEQALEVRRRLLTDNHPLTAASYNEVAFNLDALGKYVLAQPLFEKALSIRRRLLTDDHPLTAVSYTSMAHSLSMQGKYTQAQTLYEKALQIKRRVLTDEHPSTARSYSNLAFILHAQGKYAEAQPLCVKARLRSAAVCSPTTIPTIARPWPSSGPTQASPSWTAWPPRANWGGSASSTWRRTG